MIIFYGKSMQMVFLVASRFTRGPISTMDGLDPFRTAVPFSEQTTQIPSILYRNGTAVLKGLKWAHHYNYCCAWYDV